MGKINFALLNCSAVNYSPVNVSGAGFAAGGGGKKSYTVAELCAMGYGVATDYGYNMKGDFAAAGVPIPTDLAARLAGEDGVLLKVTGLKADADFWEAVRQALAAVTVNWSDPLRSYFDGTNIGGDVEMTVTGGEYQTATNLGGQGLRKLTLNLPSGFVSVMSNAFVWAVSLEEFVVNGTVKANDWTGAFDHCTALTSFTAPQWDDNASLNAYSHGVSYMTSAFQNCTALTAVPQYGAEREAEANTLRPVAMQNMLNASGVTVLGPVVDLRYIDPAGTQAAGAFGTQLQDARLMNLNHGDWWLDGTVPEDGVSHGNLSDLDAESVAYLMGHLWDLSTDKTGKNWRTVENSWMMWSNGASIELTDARNVVNFILNHTGQAASPLHMVGALNGFKFRVTGLAEGDRLEFGSGVVAPSEESIYEDGEYVISKPNGVQGFKLYNDTETGYRTVTLEIVNEPYDAGNHLVDAAALHVPESWREKLTTDMLASAAARGWSAWIGEENLTAGLPSIFDSLVLWYDIAKQGATNETMEANPVLKDLSGHGHDATCYNFAWAGMSGVGGFATNYNTYWKYKGVEVNDHVITSTTVGEGVLYNWLVFIDAKIHEVPSYKIKVTGTTSLTGLIYRYVDENNTVQYFNIQGDGEYTLPAIHLYNGDGVNQNCGFQITHREPLLIIEQLPQYPGALVSDGVDDYALVEELPLLNKEAGFTVIARRKWIGDPHSKSQGFVSKGSNVYWDDGAFYFECVEGGGSALFNRVFSIGEQGVNYINTSFTENDVTYLTSTKYNDSEIKNIGDGIDTDKLVIFRLCTDYNFYSSIALYSLLLFNRDLTDEEIEWVKNNLIGNNTEV